MFFSLTKTKVFREEDQEKRKMSRDRRDSFNIHPLWAKYSFPSSYLELALGRCVDLIIHVMQIEQSGNGNIALEEEHDPLKVLMESIQPVMIRDEEAAARHEDLVRASLPLHISFFRSRLLP